MTGSLERSRRDASAQVVAAARRCFAEVGVQRTRMEDVAAEAGMVRTSVYRHFANRDALVEGALLARIREFSQALIAETDLEAADLRSEFVGLVVRSIRIGRGDPEFRYLMDALPGRFGSFVTGPGSPIHAIVFDTFAPLIARARSSGQLRDDASDHDIVEWIQGITTLFVPRDDLTDFEERRRLRLFLLPAVFAG